MARIFLHLETHEQSLYNWYFMPSIHLFDYKQLEKLFSDNGFSILYCSANKDDNILKKILVSISPRSSITIKSKKYFPLNKL